MRVFWHKAMGKVKLITFNLLVYQISDFLNFSINITITTMNRLKELKYFTLIMLVFGYVAVGSLTSCRDQKKEAATEEQGEHPEGEEHPTEEGATEEEHPTEDGAAEEEHPEN